MKPSFPRRRESITPLFSFRLWWRNGFPSRVPVFAGMTLYFLLTACGGPASIGMMAVSTGLGVYSGQQLKEEQEQEKYINRCLASHTPVDAYAVGIDEEYGAVVASKQYKDLEVTKHMVNALEYYLIANRLGDPRAKARLNYLENIMPVREKHEAHKRFAKYTDINLQTCYVTTFE